MKVKHALVSLWKHWFVIIKVSILACLDGGWGGETVPLVYGPACWTSRMWTYIQSNTFHSAFTRKVSIPTTKWRTAKQWQPCFVIQTVHLISFIWIHFLLYFSTLQLFLLNPNHIYILYEWYIIKIIQIWIQHSIWECKTSTDWLWLSGTISIDLDGTTKVESYIPTATSRGTTYF